MHSRHSWQAILLGMSLLMMIPSIGRADAIYSVSLDISALLDSSQQYTLDFILFDGSGMGNGNNTVTISNFNFGAAPVSLTDSSFFNEALVLFTPVQSSLSFLLSITTNMEAFIPDMFTFAILDSSLTPIPTLDPFLVDNFLSINLDSPTGTVITSATDIQGTDIRINAPQVQLEPEVSPVPEPGTLGLLAFGLSAMAMRGFRRKS
jgi:hypothetical protein